MKRTECFKIRILVSNDPFKKIGINKIKDIRCAHKFSFAEPTTIVADPFIFVKDDTLYLFYENKKMYHNGIISMTKTTDLINWSKPTEVLKESCHLSYPWVFEMNGHIYMIPETSGLKEIRLYEGNKDLTKFTYKKTILKDQKEISNGFSFSDTSIYKRGDYYYMMTTVNDGIKNELKLYMSKHFDCNYEEHPMSPISYDNKYGRNAGSMFEHAGTLYRVAQNCEKRYGDNVNLLEVKELSPKVYKENVVENNIISGNNVFYKEGGHQFNMVKFKGKYIIATDAKEYHYFFLNRIFHKLGVYGG